ncbi:molybdenum ABC transporter permease [Chryseobacterium indologenes]|uniref:hypothetical protein n=1 Tax=Chryseobacterium TaxID=59732 RepID=UPI0003E08094|nr:MULTISPECIES: hypothetical protein [Chryseobacterium]MBF6645027.1 molybdenum ABC transporter permease [Chryseobacterium indologenes]MBU3047773.1 molybdenum ABC transporter permease [Chryseobacterium indologenes]MEB4759304.1 molybdenum ABC transporter permease [Chryseobacterium indologenes]QPQ50885.1 molybdenum ABC transporter permease [Chryseobacterium indologenes]QQQ71295.1 molybdenum ABC transporter permease [Chryseobacterium indologenes]
MDYTFLIMGIFLLMTGIALRYWINRRRFNRRNAAGLEGFTTYEHATVIMFIEGIGKLISYTVIMVGFLFLLIHWQDKKRIEREARNKESISARTLFFKKTE